MPSRQKRTATLTILFCSPKRRAFNQSLPRWAPFMPSRGSSRTFQLASSQLSARTLATVKPCFSVSLCVRHL